MRSKIYGILFVVLMFVLFMVGIILFPSLFFAFLGSIFIAIPIGGIVFFVPFLYFLFKGTGVKFGGCNAYREKKDLFTMCRLLCTGVILALLSVFYYRMTDQYTMPEYQNVATYELIANGFNLLLLGPILEELFFRKWMIEYLEKKGVETLYILVLTTVLFLLVHIGWDKIWYSRLDVIPFAIVLGLIYMKYRDVRYCIFVHFVNNLVVNLINLSNYLLQ